MEKPIMERVAERVEAYKKENPLSKEQILNMSLYDYYNDLNNRFFKEIAAEEKKLKAGVIIHDKYNYRVCNICNEEEIEFDSKNGVCTQCLENRVTDGILTNKIAYSEDLIFDENGAAFLKGQALIERDEDHVNSMLKEFKNACTVGYCLEQWKGNNGSQYEKWQGKKGTVIIEIYAGGAGFETYKQSPDPELEASIDFINS